MAKLRPGWCHCMSNTYGTWLPGDPRGFRTRGHREHVEGDYKSPPTADYSGRLDANRKRLKKPPVILCPESRAMATASIRTIFLEIHRLELLAVSVSARHMHLLARFPAGRKPASLRGGLSVENFPFRLLDPVRFHVGIAKERSAKRLASEGLVAPGKIWAKKGKIVRIKERSHQINVVNYILAHAQKNAAVWSFRDGPDAKIPVPS